MSIEHIVDELLRTEIGGVVVTDRDGNVAYSDEKLRFSEHVTRRFMSRAPVLQKTGERKHWEFTDSELDKYYRVLSVLKEDEGKEYICHCVTDVSELAHLSKNISEYSRKIQDFSDFQTKILKVISKPYDSFLPALAELCGSEEIIIRIERLWSRLIAVTTYSGGEVKRISYPISEAKDDLFSAKRFDRIDGYRCLLGEEVAERRCVILVKESSALSEEYIKDIAVYSVIRLFVENGVLREKIIYEGEHDQLTGLYNHSKFTRMAAEDFGKPETIAVYMACVSDLEYMNDHYGNQAGDALIKRAVDSIFPQLTSDILGFRIGGDKFAVVARNISEDYAHELLDTWRKKLGELNETDGLLKCTISCGLAYASGDYDTDKLLEQADVGMYREKRRLKEELIKRAAVT